MGMPGRWRNVFASLSLEQGMRARGSFLWRCEMLRGSRQGCNLTKRIELSSIRLRNGQSAHFLVVLNHLELDGQRLVEGDSADG